VLYERERLVLLEPRAKGILGTILHHNYEVRCDSVYFDEISDLRIGKELLDLASHIIDTKKASFEPEKFRAVSGSSHQSHPLETGGKAGAGRACVQAQQCN